jgi:hypothetical protein
MFDNVIKPQTPSVFSRVMQFLGQELLAMIGVAIVSYPIFRAGEMALQEHGSTKESTLLWAWWWIATLIPIAIGFAAGHSVQAAWPDANVTGRFVGILPAIIFIHDLAGAFATLPSSMALETTLSGGAPELYFGAILYSFGVARARRKTQVT